MLFNSLQFFVFFPIVIFIFFLTPHRFRWALLLLTSYYFYMAWKPKYVILIIISTLINYFAARPMGRFAAGDVRRKLLLYSSLIGNLSILFFFKYFNFFNESITQFLNIFNIFYDSNTFSLLLPIGISFYTFQSISYTVDVYRGVRKPEPHLGIFALYVSFFPQLVAGPIERSTRLLPQFYKKMQFNSTCFVSGLRLMLWGFFLKIVIADNSGIIVNTVYGDVEGFGGLAFIIATFFFAIQIFGDFAGYSYIAIGSARIMGYDLMTNFRRPYFARSIAEFWRRWHISLMSWFRDYVYIPLGGSRVSKIKWARNILIVFFLSGLWHGANWTFIVWGLLNALYMLFSTYTKKYRDYVVQLFRFQKVPVIHIGIQIFSTFILTLFAWIFFRAQTLSDAILIIRRIGADMGTLIYQITDINTLTKTIASFGITSKIQFIAVVVAIGIMFAVHILQERGIFRTWFYTKSAALRWFFYYAIIVYIIFFGFIGKQPFFYFQF